MFSLVIGLSLLINGATVDNADAFSKFEIDPNYLTLIGISQGVYVGGKAIGGNVFGELNVKLDKVRELELAFVTAVANSAAWTGAGEAERVLKLAREKAAPTEYAAYRSAANEASELTGYVTGVPIEPQKIEPSLPATG